MLKKEVCFIEIQVHKENANLSCELYSVAEIVSNTCTAYIYADKDLKLLVHKEVSSKRPHNFVRTTDGHLIRKFEYSDCEWKQYVNSVAIQEATKKIGRNIIEMCLRGGLYD